MSNSTEVEESISFAEADELITEDLLFLIKTLTTKVYLAQDAINDFMQCKEFKSRMLWCLHSTKYYINNDKCNIVRDYPEFIYQNLMGSEGCVYLIYNELSDIYKIGRSKKVYNRVKQLSNSCGSKLQLLDVYIPRVVDYKDLEKSLHGHYSSIRLEGEWFSEIDPLSWRELCKSKDCE